MRLQQMASKDIDQGAKGDLHFLFHSLSMISGGPQEAQVLE
jgi:hypothetical protein